MHFRNALFAGLRSTLVLYSMLLACFLSFIFVSHAIASSIRTSTSAATETPIPREKLSLGLGPTLELNKTADAKPAKIQSSLNQLATMVKGAGTAALATAQAQNMKVLGNRVQVQIATHPAGVENALRTIREAGGEPTKIASDQKLIQAWIPPEMLEEVSRCPDIFTIRQPEVAHAADTEALSVTNVPNWNNSGYTGAGVKVGVIDVGFQGYQGLLGEELPPSVVVKNFVDGESDAQLDGTSAHGAACAEIIHDIARDANLCLAKISTLLDFEEAVQWMQNTCRADIISTSISFFNVSPGDGTGFLANLVRQAHDAGILWVTAAGTVRDQHWGGQFNDPDSNRIHNFIGSQEVNFFGPGNGNAYLIPSGVLLTVYTRWDDWSAVDQDYDVYIVRWNGSNWVEVGAPGFDIQDGNRSSLGQQPTETALALTTGDAAPYGFYIERFNSNRNVNFEIFAIGWDRLDTPIFERSLTNLADAPDAVTVAAVNVDAPFAQESYSSEGPANGPGGTAAGGFLKPDIAAYDRVSTVSFGVRGFAGTSAATPHAAGAAALVLDAHPDYSADELKSFLTTFAIDQGTSGPDTKFGYGRLFLPDPITIPAFVDVPANYWAANDIQELFAQGISKGCLTSPPLYCPEQAITRAEMAVFLERSLRGGSFDPPPSSGVFGDVATSYWASDWIEQLYLDGITTGCRSNPLLYCPDQLVTRADMSLFLLRSRHGGNYQPPPATGLFSDVPLSHYAADWIEQLYREGITTGCRSTPLAYCPGASVTRGEMAAFLVRTFGLF